MSDVTTLNPITEFSPPLVLNPIFLDLPKELSELVYNELEQYISTLKIPFWANCIIENKYIKVRTNEFIVIEYPDFLITDNTDFVFPDDLSKKQQQIINLIKKIYPELSDIEILSYIGLINEKDPKLFDKISCCINSKNCKSNEKKNCKSDEKKNCSIFNSLLSYNNKDKDKDKDKDKHKDKCCDEKYLIDKINKIINKYINITNTIVIGKSGVNAINKANLSITSNAFSRNDFVQIFIPNFIQNFYTFNKFLEYLQDKQILRNIPKLIKRKDSLPRYEALTDNFQIIVQNARIYNQNNFKKYLDENKLEGFINYDPQKVVDDN
jgi:hypothetical protein